MLCLRLSLLYESVEVKANLWEIVVCWQWFNEVHLRWQYYHTSVTPPPTSGQRTLTKGCITAKHLPQTAPPVGGSRRHLLGFTPAHILNGTSTGSAVSVGFTAIIIIIISMRHVTNCKHICVQQANRQRDKQTHHSTLVTIGCITVHAMELVQLAKPD